MAQEENQELKVEKLFSGDRPSVYALGIFGSEALKRSQMAVFMIDILGRVVIMPPDAIKVLRKPRISDTELDGMSEEDSINLMLEQGDEQSVVIAYLKGREVRNG